MPDDKPPASWQMLTAAITIAISLFSNFVQYRSLKAKQTELEQAQQKIDAVKEAGDECRRAVDRQEGELQGRMSDLNEEYEKASEEFNRMGVALANFLKDPDQIRMALATMKEAQATGQRVDGERKALQKQIDDLPSKKAACPTI